MKAPKILLSCLLLAGCVPGDCFKNCYWYGTTNIPLKHKCDMDPYHPDCPVNR